MTNGIVTLAAVVIYNLHQTVGRAIEIASGQKKFFTLLPQRPI